MHTFIHLFIGVAAMIALKIQGWPAVVFVISAVMIDIDHLLEIFKGVHNIKRKYVWDVRGFKEANYQGVQRSLHIFHTFEAMLAIFIASRYFPILFYVGLSFGIHLLTDAWGNIWNRNVKKKGGADWLKHWFLAYYIKKRSVFNVKD